MTCPEIYSHIIHSNELIWCLPEKNSPFNFQNEIMIIVFDMDASISFQKLNYFLTQTNPMSSNIYIWKIYIADCIVFCRLRRDFNYLIYGPTNQCTFLCCALNPYMQLKHKMLDFMTESFSGRQKKTTIQRKWIQNTIQMATIIY